VALPPDADTSLLARAAACSIVFGDGMISWTAVCWVRNAVAYIHTGVTIVEEPTARAPSPSSPAYRFKGCLGSGGRGACYISTAVRL
jgi:hypothetical protein